MSVDSVDTVDQCSDPLLTPYLRATLYACSSLMMVSLLPITSSFADCCLNFDTTINILRLSFFLYVLKLSSGTGQSVVSEILQFKTRASSKLSCRLL